MPIGGELALRCAEAGAVCYAGYTGKLALAFAPRDEAEHLLEALSELVTETTIAIADGETDANEIRRRLHPIRDEILRRCPAANHGAGLGAPTDRVAHDLPRLNPDAVSAGAA